MFQIFFYKIQNNNIDLQNVSENLGMELQKNFSLVKSMLEEPVLRNFVPFKFKELLAVKGAHGGVVVKALRYKPAGRGFDSRWCHWNFSVT